MGWSEPVVPGKASMLLQLLLLLPPLYFGLIYVDVRHVLLNL